MLLLFTSCFFHFLLFVDVVIGCCFVLTSPFSDQNFLRGCRRSVSLSVLVVGLSILLLLFRRCSLFLSFLFFKIFFAAPPLQPSFLIGNLFIYLILGVPFLFILLTSCLYSFLMLLFFCCCCFFLPPRFQIKFSSRLSPLSLPSMLVRFIHHPPPPLLYPPPP